MIHSLYMYYNDSPLMYLLFVVGVYSNEVKGAIFVFYGLSSGVTQVVFSYCGKYLYSGERKVAATVA